MPKVSVVIPVYGVEKYIERCARSLFSQTIEDIEYIFVDDCSKDNSIEILKETIKDYPERIPHISIITHQTNKGLPQARKTGVLAATGDYIVHCDSDDWVDHNLYEAMYRKAIDEDSDLVVCDFCVVTQSGLLYRNGILSTNVDDIIKDMLLYRTSFNVWNKMYKRNLYEGVEFPTANMGEDLGTTFQLAVKCNKISRITGFYYYYNGVTPSITRNDTKSAIINRVLQACDNANSVIRMLDNSKYDAEIVYLKFRQRKQLMPIINDKDAYKIWKTIYPEINQRVILDYRLAIPLLDRVKFALTLTGIFPVIKQYTRKNIC